VRTRVRRLAAIDWLLTGTFLPIFLFGVVMSVVHGVRGDLVCLPKRDDLRQVPF